MQVKKFEAPTMQEALDSVKKELGPEAIILQTKKSRKGLGILSKSFIEITAAIPEKHLKKKKDMDAKIPVNMKDSYHKLSAIKQSELTKKYQSKINIPKSQPPTKALTATRYIDIEDSELSKIITQPVKSEVEAKAVFGMKQYVSNPDATPELPSHDLKSEINQLRKIIDDMAANQTLSGAQSSLKSDSLNSTAVSNAFEQMVLNGIDKKYAHSLLRKVAFELGESGCQNFETVVDTLAHEMIETIQITSPFSESTEKLNKSIVISFVGPTGVGKTSSLAKLAGQLIKKNGLKVGFINLDHSKKSSVDQLMTYSKILHVPFRSVHSAEDLKSCLNDFHFLDVILIDTAGHSQRDQESLHKTKTILSSVPQLHSYLVLSSITRDVEMYDASHRFSIFNPLGLVMTKLDETVIYGGIYNISQKTKLPFTYFTTGQKIPEDIESASAERLVSLILEIN